LNKILIYFLIASPLLSVGTKAKAKTDFRITGFIQERDGSGVKGAQIFILNSEDEEIANSKSKKDGEFKIKKKLKAGSYKLIAKHKKKGNGETLFTLEKNDLDLIVIITNTEDIDTAEENNSSEIIEKYEPITLPRQEKKDVKNQIKFEETFFEYESSLKKLKSEIDSLKTIVRGYEKKQSMPNLDRDILDLIQVPSFQNRIQLQNGTIVMGNILQESDSSLTLKTQIGKLVLKKEMVVKMDKLEKPGPKVVFIGEPFINYYPDKQIFTGKIKNIGKIRADFVRVSGKLFDQTTSNVGMDSIFVKGSRVVYNSNVIADTALEPGQIASYSLTVPIKKGRKPEYHTMDIYWKETQ
tara:strand:+ start:288 stop:1349 length:1062 start_codon:yes stop_codon:yes gene_type:complete